MQEGTNSDKFSSDALSSKSFLLIFIGQFTLSASLVWCWNNLLQSLIAESSSSIISRLYSFKKTLNGNIGSQVKISVASIPALVEIHGHENGDIDPFGKSFGTKIL